MIFLIISSLLISNTQLLHQVQKSFTYVSSNDYDASYEMTEKIISLGHKNWFCKGHEMHSASSLRFNGFINAMDELHLKEI